MLLSGTSFCVTEEAILISQRFVSELASYQPRLNSLLCTMPLLHSKLAVPCPALICDPNKLLCPLFGHVADVKFVQFICPKRSNSPPFAMISSTTMLDPLRSSKKRVDPVETSGSRECGWSEVTAGAPDNNCEEGKLNSEIVSSGCFNDKSYKESERRRKIGEANKGKVPWNVGIRHSEETRMRIKQRTIEALRDPKIRQKMSEHPRTHSDLIKAKIGSSLRYIWKERLKRRRLKEKFFSSWADNIAEAAKTGWSDQRELDWDSYDKLKHEIDFQHLHRLAEKERAKSMAKMRAHKEAAEAKAEKMARLAQKRKEREEKAKERGKTKRVSCSRAKKKKNDLAVDQGMKLKKSLLKINRKRSLKVVQVTGQVDAVLSHIPAWEKLDLDHIMREKAQRKPSLADQIQAAKNQSKVHNLEALLMPSSVHSSSDTEMLDMFDIIAIWRSPQ
ncbi:inner centromere protein [Rhodamnia argentea]|uniref:Inner centromere protein n=1 Tax=Rhodamnia argentea TaxID=178133 RepID=A0ABM3GZQ4_9MYRT|nr:inner centromere protein [Rhodamnia argentea]